VEHASRRFPLPSIVEDVCVIEWQRHAHGERECRPSDMSTLGVSPIRSHRVVRFARPTKVAASHIWNAVRLDRLQGARRATRQRRFSAEELDLNHSGKRDGGLYQSNLQMAFGSVTIPPNAQRMVKRGQQEQASANSGVCRPSTFHVLVT
jgi:hypothetical protein